MCQKWDSVPRHSDEKVDNPGTFSTQDSLSENRIFSLTFYPLNYFDKGTYRDRETETEGERREKMGERQR